MSFASTWGSWFPSRILDPVWRLDRTHLAPCGAPRTAGQILGRYLQPTIACAIKASTHVSICCSPVKANEWLSSSRLAIRFGESHPTNGAPPGRGAHARGVFFLVRSGLTEPLTYRRNIALDLVVSRPDRPSTPPRSLPLGGREALRAFPIRYAFHRPGDLAQVRGPLLVYAPVSRIRSNARRLFARSALLGFNRAR